MAGNKKSHEKTPSVQPSEIKTNAADMIQTDDGWPDIDPDIASREKGFLSFTDQIGPDDDFKAFTRRAAQMQKPAHKRNMP